MGQMLLFGLFQLYCQAGSSFTIGDKKNSGLYSILTTIPTEKKKKPLPQPQNCFVAFDLTGLDTNMWLGCPEPITKVRGLQCSDWPCLKLKVKSDSPGHM